MTVLDAQAVVAYLTGEPAAQEVGAILRGGNARIASINVAETVDVLVRLQRHASEDVLEKLDWLLAGGLQVEALDERRARSAGLVRAERYDRARNPLSLADCITLATALDPGEPLATADPALARTGRDLACSIVALPDSQGRRPAV